MEFKTATMDDFDVAFDYIEKLWDYNTYDKEVIRKVYADVLADEDSFAFFLMDGGHLPWLLPRRLLQHLLAVRHDLLCLQHHHQRRRGGARVMA